MAKIDCLLGSYYVALSNSATASFDNVINSSSMHFIAACIEAATRIFAPMLACPLLQHWRGLGLSYRQRAMFIVKDLITQ